MTRFWNALLLAGLLGTAPSPTRAGDGACVQLTISGVRSADGVVQIALFADEESYEKSTEAAAQVAPPAAVGTVEVPMCGLAPGRYALSVFHDENANRRLDTGRLGIPKEGYGFSQGARGRTGKPSFDKIAFDLAAGGTHAETIKLLYWSKR